MSNQSRSYWIERHGRQWPLSLACEVLRVSVSGYLEHRCRRDARKLTRPGSGRLSDELLLVHMQVIHAEVRQEYSWPRMWKELLAQGHRVGKERVRRLMSQHGIRARGKRKFVAPLTAGTACQWRRGPAAA